MPRQPSALRQTDRDYHSPVLLPDFVVIGAPRSGTTWLYTQLSRHPGLYLPDNKEPRFLAVDPGEPPVFTGPGDDAWAQGMVVGRDEYERLFAAAGDRRKGEASTDYLYQGAATARNMRELVPSVRLVAILRNPAERAHSAWRYLRRLGHETLSFDEALAAEQRRIAEGWAWCWHYAQHGFYGRNLAPFLETFPADRILVLAYADLARRPQALLDEVTEFVGVAPLRGERLDERVNEVALTRELPRAPVGAGLAKRALPAPVLRAAGAAIGRFSLYKPSLGRRSRSRLAALFERDLALLEELTGRRLEL